MPNPLPPLPWLLPGQDFPAIETAWDASTPAPGLLAAGGSLAPQTLARAYAQGVFPWFSEGQPILWWSPSPRMVLQVDQFRLHRSLRRRIEQFRTHSDCEIRMDTAFAAVIEACSSSLRHGQAGTWIVPDMIDAYIKLHQAGLAHSVETWIDGELHGGLYCVCLGGAVFGESMFTRSTDASKIALAALVSFCRRHGITHIDCQQRTEHLYSMGARELPRELFLAQIKSSLQRLAPEWRYDPLYWHQISPLKPLET